MFKQYYKLFGDIHSFNTRGSPYQIIIERHSSNIGHSTMKIRRIKLWNQISEDIKRTNDVAAVCRSLAQYVDVRTGCQGSRGEAVVRGP